MAKWRAGLARRKPARGKPVTLRSCSTDMGLGGPESVRRGGVAPGCGRKDWLQHSDGLQTTRLLDAHSLAPAPLFQTQGCIPDPAGSIRVHCGTRVAAGRPEIGSWAKHTTPRLRASASRPDFHWLLRVSLSSGPKKKWLTTLDPSSMTTTSRTPILVRPSPSPRRLVRSRKAGK